MERDSEESKPKPETPSQVVHKRAEAPDFEILKKLAQLFPLRSGQIPSRSLR